MTLRAGMLLVAEPAMRDPNFRQTVVLLCQHDADGTFGLVVNRPTIHQLAEVLVEPVGLDHRLFLGGPVQPDTLHFVHGYTDTIEQAIPVAPGLGWGGPFDAVAEAIRLGQLDGSRFRFFVGYAGWEPGQLETEIEQGGWRTVPADGHLVLDADPEALWRSLVLGLGEDWAVLVNFPEEPTLN